MILRSERIVSGQFSPKNRAFRDGLCYAANPSLGTLLLNKLLEVGRAEGLRRITASILLDNYPMQRIRQEARLRLRRNNQEMVMKADLYQPA